MSEREMSLQREMFPAKGEYVRGRGRVLNYGLYGEEFSALRKSEFRPARTHSNGAREAAKAEQF